MLEGFGTATIAAALGVALLAGCLAIPHPPITGELVEESFSATAVDDTYRILVRLPPEHADQPERTFPVLYQLDAVFAGMNQHAVTAGWVSELEARGELPPTIVVGVGYTTPDGPGNGRFRDYTFAVPDPDPISGPLYGYGAAAFHEFLSEELLPHIDATYRGDGASRTLVGHSLGGLFVLYALLRDDAAGLRPFGRFVAASPSYPFENGAVLELEADYAAAHTDLPARLYIGVGELEAAFSMNVYDEAMGRRLLGRGYARLALRRERLEGVDHLGNVAASYPEGLRFVFAAGLP